MDGFFLFPGPLIYPKTTTTTPKPKPKPKEKPKHSYSEKHHYGQPLIIPVALNYGGYEHTTTPAPTTAKSHTYSHKQHYGQPLFIPIAYGGYEHKTTTAAPTTVVKRHTYPQQYFAVLPYGYGGGYESEETTETETETEPSTTPAPPTTEQPKHSYKNHAPFLFSPPFPFLPIPPPIPPSFQHKYPTETFYSFTPPPGYNEEVEIDDEEESRSLSNVVPKNAVTPPNFKPLTKNPYLPSFGGGDDGPSDFPGFMSQSDTYPDQYRPPSLKRPSRPPYNKRKQSSTRPPVSRRPSPPVYSSPPRRPYGSSRKPPPNLNDNSESPPRFYSPPSRKPTGPSRQPPPEIIDDLGSQSVYLPPPRKQTGPPRKPQPDLNDIAETPPPRVYSPPPRKQTGPPRNPPSQKTPVYDSEGPPQRLPPPRNQGGPPRKPASASSSEELGGFDYVPPPTRKPSGPQRQYSQSVSRPPTLDYKAPPRKPEGPPLNSSPNINVNPERPPQFDYVAPPRKQTITPPRPSLYTSPPPLYLPPQNNPAGPPQSNNNFITSPQTVNLLPPNNQSRPQKPPLTNTIFPPATSSPAINNNRITPMRPPALPSVYETPERMQMRNMPDYLEPPPLPASFEMPGFSFQRMFSRSQQEYLSALENVESGNTKNQQQGGDIKLSPDENTPDNNNNLTLNSTSSPVNTMPPAEPEIITVPLSYEYELPFEPLTANKVKNDSKQKLPTIPIQLLPKKEAVEPTSVRSTLSPPALPTKYEMPQPLNTVKEPETAKSETVTVSPSPTKFSTLEPYLFTMYPYKRPAISVYSPPVQKNVRAEYINTFYLPPNQDTFTGTTIEDNLITDNYDFTTTTDIFPPFPLRQDGLSTDHWNLRDTIRNPNIEPTGFQALTDSQIKQIKQTIAKQRIKKSKL